jgi:hypothetical protein
MQRDGVLVRSEVFAVAKSLALKTLQFLSNGPKRPLEYAHRFD